MKPQQLDKLLRLIKRTGDKCVILDRDSDETFALMSLDEYEYLLNGVDELDEMDEDGLWSKIDNDVSRWREKHEGEGVEELPKLPSVDDGWTPATEPVVTESMDLLEDLPEEKPAEPEILPITEPGQQVEPTNNITSDEIPLHDVPEDEEEKFYLEPV